MKKTVKTISLILVVITVMGVFASCGVSNGARKERGSFVQETTELVLYSKYSYHLINNPRILLMALRLKIKGYGVELYNGSLYAYKGGKEVHAFTCHSLPSAVREKQLFASHGYCATRIGKVVCYSYAAQGTIDAVSIPEGLWVHLIVKLNLPRYAYALIS